MLTFLEYTQSVKNEWGDDVMIHVNPGKEEFHTALERSHPKELRAILHKDKLYAWDSSKAIHGDIARSLKISNDELGGDKRFSDHGSYLGFSLSRSGPSLQSKYDSDDYPDKYDSDHEVSRKDLIWDKKFDHPRIDRLYEHSKRYEDDEWDSPITIHTNPTKNQFQHILTNSKFGELRGILDTKKNNVHVWDAAEGIHFKGMRMLGLKDADDDFAGEDSDGIHRFRWSKNEPSYMNPSYKGFRATGYGDKPDPTQELFQHPRIKRIWS